MRLFVALQAPGHWQRAAAGLQRSLGEALPAGARQALRMVDPELMHLTLRFLGDVTDDQLEPLDAALAEHVPPVEIDLALDAASTFGVPPRTSVAWLGVTGDRAGLQALAARVEAAVRAAGLPPEDREFRPHLTLARVRRETSGSERRAIAEAVRALDPPGDETRVVVHEAVLVRSHLGGAQPRYEVLGRYGPPRS